MSENDMTFAEIQSNKEKFLRQYEVTELFPKCGVSWETLMNIGNDYETKCYGEGRDRQEYKGEYFRLIQKHIANVASFENVHSYRFRIKKTGSLLAKIIRKAVEHSDEITVNNYFQIITDLLGIRILYVFKEDYWPVHEQIMHMYGNQLTQDISIKLKAGDNRKMYSNLLQKSNVRVDENETYRSIHYTLYARDKNTSKCPRLEIQTRTIFEEGWSEINHKLVYKRGVGNPNLQTTSSVLSAMVGACDTIGMLMKMLYDTGVRADQSISDVGTHVTNEDDSVAEVIRKFLQT